MKKRSTRWGRLGLLVVAAMVLIGLAGCAKAYDVVITPAEFLKAKDVKPPEPGARTGTLYQWTIADQFQRDDYSNWSTSGELRFVKLVRGVPLSKYVEEAKQFVAQRKEFSGVKVLEERDLNINGVPAKEIIYEFELNSIRKNIENAVRNGVIDQADAKELITHRMYQVHLIKEGYGYTLSMIASLKIWDEYLPAFREMAMSIQFLPQGQAAEQYRRELEEKLRSAPTQSGGGGGG